MQLRSIGIKRVVLNPRAYLRPFMVCVLAHHVPLLVSYSALDRPTGTAACARLASLFDWLFVAFVLHVVTASLMAIDVAITMCQPVYRVRRPERWLILVIFALYVVNLAWTIYGEASFRIDTSVCPNDSDAIQDRADTIAYYQHIDFVVTAIIVALGSCSSYLCGVHTNADLAEAERRWQRRCTSLFRACSCSRTMREPQQAHVYNNIRVDRTGSTNVNSDNEEEDDEEHLNTGTNTGFDTDHDDIFASLGKILGNFFVVRYNTTKFEGLAFNDLAFMLGLVSKSQQHERASSKLTFPPPVAQRLPVSTEANRLKDLAFFAKLAIGIYGWPIYVWYAPLSWCKGVFGCCASSPLDQIVDFDTAVQSNRASFVGYTGIDTTTLVYLNCYNYVFQAPYAIVKDPMRRELIVSVRGSMSFYDFVTDGLAKVEAMLPDELPFDIPNRHATWTHYGMLRTARQLLGDLQVGSRKQLFWDVCMQQCRTNTGKNTGTNTETHFSSDPIEPSKRWRIVVCGHSMGAGVGAILAVMLRRHFPDTRAFLYAPPMLFDPLTAAWTRTFMTTAVYGDDVVPRLSIANVTRLRDEMATHFHQVADEPLYRVRFGRLRHQQLNAPGSQDSVELDIASLAESSSGSHAQAQPVPVEAPPATLPPTPIARSYRSLSDVAAALSLRLSSALSASGIGPSQRAHRASQKLDLHFLRVSTLDAEQEVDVPGEIIHIETVHAARKCSCTVLRGEQELTYTLRDASYFRRIYVNARAVQDHMVHHYDRQIAHLVNNCLDLEGEHEREREDEIERESRRERRQDAEASSELSALSWLEQSTTDDDMSVVASSVAPYREMDEVV